MFNIRIIVLATVRLRSVFYALGVWSNAIFWWALTYLAEFSSKALELSLRATALVHGWIKNLWVWFLSNSVLAFSMLLPFLMIFYWDESHNFLNFAFSEKISTFLLYLFSTLSALFLLAIISAFIFYPKSSLELNELENQSVFWEKTVNISAWILSSGTLGSFFIFTLFFRFSLIPGSFDPQPTEVEKVVNLERSNQDHLNGGAPIKARSFKTETRGEISSSEDAVLAFDDEPQCTPDEIEADKFCDWRKERSVKNRAALELQRIDVTGVVAEKITSIAAGDTGRWIDLAERAQKTPFEQLLAGEAGYVAEDGRIVDLVDRIPPPRVATHDASGDERDTLVDSWTIKSLSGTWEGKIQQSFPSSNYGVRVTFDGGGLPSTRGRTWYPELSCGGEIAMLNFGKTWGRFSETITRDHQRRCINGIIEFSTVDGTEITYHWSSVDDKAVASGILKRSSKEP